MSSKVRSSAVRFAADAAIVSSHLPILNQLSKVISKKKKGLTEEKGTFKVTEAVLNAPRESLCPRNERNANLDWDR
jgi:hypothetical protein